VKKIFTITLTSLLLLVMCCSSDSGDPAPPVNPPPDEETDFVFGADLSYVNQILDRGGVYKDGNSVVNPYKIFADHGATLARFRLWHDPAWTKEVYGASGTQLYNDLADVERGIAAAKAEGMRVLLDFHYSDTWADPSKQYIPEAWNDIKAIDVLEDSVYNYTLKTLTYLNNKGLLPEFVQLGNETNCGMLYSTPPFGFPTSNVCNNQWANMGKLLNAGIKAVRDLTANTTIKTKVILHVADPKNVDWWFTNIQSQGGVSDYDVIGFSFYPLWHTTVSLTGISTKVAEFKEKFDKDVMILETAYPWTTESDDAYNNHFGDTSPLSGYPFTQDGQYDFMKTLTAEIKEGGGVGVIYWEPAWISADMKDLWGTGSSWENSTFFDFEGNVIKGIDYMNFEY
jgi:arabinogalactan endo-1,4-beta-galactosidase